MSSTRSSSINSIDSLAIFQAVALSLANFKTQIKWKHLINKGGVKEVSPTYIFPCQYGDNSVWTWRQIQSRYKTLDISDALEQYYKPLLHLKLVCQSRFSFVRIIKIVIKPLYCYNFALFMEIYNSNSFLPPRQTLAPEHVQATFTFPRRETSLINYKNSQQLD